MSDWDDDEEDFDRSELPPMDTEKGRDQWIEILLEQEDEDWAEVQVVQEGKDMIARFRWDDGREEIYDLQIRRSMEVVRRAPPGEQN